MNGQGPAQARDARVRWRLVGPTLRGTGAEAGPFPAEANDLDMTVIPPATL